MEILNEKDHVTDAGVRGRMFQVKDIKTANKLACDLNGVDCTVHIYAESNWIVVCPPINERYSLIIDNARKLIKVM